MKQTKQILLDGESTTLILKSSHFPLIIDDSLNRSLHKLSVNFSHRFWKMNKFSEIISYFLDPGHNAMTKS